MERTEKLKIISTIIIVGFILAIFYHYIMIAMLLLPPTSPDYRLIYIFIPVAFFINDLRSSKNDLLYSILFGLLLITKVYIFFKSYTSTALDIGLIINPILMMFFAFLILKEGYTLSRSRNFQFDNKN
jgi:hypothetical protein